MSTSQVIGVPNEWWVMMIMMAKWYSGTLGPKVSQHLSYRWGKTPINLTQETCPNRGSNLGTLHDRRACCRLAHSGGQGKVKKSGIWVHVLSKNHKNQLMAISVSLLACHRLAHEQHWLFLSCIITDDEKCCFYADVRKRKEWLSLNKRRICRKCSNFSTWHSIS